MIQYISGTLTFKTPVLAIIETMGIGWELKIPISTYEKLPTAGKPCKLLTYLHISQDDIRIFGFCYGSRKRTFCYVEQIGGIGPKIALSILSRFSIPTFIKAVNSGKKKSIDKSSASGKNSAPAFDCRTER